MVNALQVDPSDGSSFDIPSATDGDDRHIAQCYAAAVNAVEAIPEQFSSSITLCVVCDITGHSLDDCLALKDIAFLKKRHIQYCLQQ